MFNLYHVNTRSFFSELYQFQNCFLLQATQYLFRFFGIGINRERITKSQYEICFKPDLPRIYHVFMIAPVAQKMSCSSFDIRRIR